MTKSIGFEPTAYSVPPPTQMKQEGVEPSIPKASGLKPDVYAYSTTAPYLPGGTRTHDPLIKSQVLLPTELQAVTGAEGFEPSSYGFGDRYATVTPHPYLF